MKRILASALLSALLLCSCGSTVTDPPAVTDGTDEGVVFEDADFGGAELRFLHYGENMTQYYDNYIVADDAIGEAVSDAVAQRNRLAEDKYKVKITAEECIPFDEAEKRIQSGQVDFDVIHEWGILTRDLALEGMLYDLNRLEGLNLDRSYWVPNVNKGLTVEDRLFMATNMVSMSSIAYSDVYFFNKAVLDELELTSPYDHVKDGTWTYETVYEMVAAAEKDLNGDGELTSFHDRCGGISGADLLHGMCDSPLVEKDEDGTYNIIPYTEEMVAVYQKYKSKLDKVFYYADEAVFDLSIDPMKHYSPFTNDRALFYKGILWGSRIFKGMESGYGIVPTPVRVAGDSYSCKIDAHAPLFSVPAKAENPEMTALVLDYMAYESERLLLPAYREVLLGAKTDENEKEYEMLQLIRDSATYDWVEVYMYDSDLLTIREKLLSAGSFSSVVKRYLPALQREIDDTVAKIVAAGRQEPVVTE